MNKKIYKNLLINIMDKALFILFFFIIIRVIKSQELQYKITILDENLKEAAYITPVISESGFLYIITGEKEEEEKYQPGVKTYNRTILKFDINSGDLIERCSINNIPYPFLYGESIMIGNKSEYLLTSTLYSIEVWERIINYAYSEYQIYSHRRFIKQDGDSFYYGFITNNTKNYMQIIRMKLTYNNSDYFNGIKIMDISNYVKVMQYEEMISCDLTEDKENILCVYISEDLFFYISAYNKQLKLLLNEKKESWNGQILNYFMKIVYFKDNSKFIIINSQNDYITRLRYYKYVNNEFISQLSPLIDSNNQYLDVDETQLDGYYFSNDIIAVDSDKIFKIYTSNDRIILTIFQFYDYDLLHIKIYIMKGFNDYGFNYFSNPRIAMFRDSLLICLKTIYNNKETTGFLFLNYPTSKDIILEENNIKIKDLVSIENNIFSLNLKFRILQIPKDFIIISKLKSQEIKEDEDLEIDDELILRQYRINEGTYILKYEGISIGDDLKYSSSKIYPKGKGSPPSSDILIEGKHGKVEINFKHCLDKYYRLDYDLNLCTDVKPKGYYLDEDEKIFKACELPCLDCYGPKINYTHMNCKTCQENYNITSDTNSCYNFLPDNYYLDEDIFKRCHPRCLKCFNGSEDDNNMNCLSCIFEENIFYRRDTHNCIFPDKSEEFKEIEIESSIFFYIFLIILLISIVCSVIILSFLRYKENNNNYINNNMNNNHANNNNDYFPLFNNENNNRNNNRNNNNNNDNHNEQNQIEMGNVRNN